MVLLWLLLWAVILGVGAAVAIALFLAVWLPTLYVLKVRRKRLATAFALPIVVAAYIGFVIGLWVWSTTPDRVFEDTFHMPPTEDVAALRSSLSIFADSGEVYLQFTCEPATVEELAWRSGMSHTPANDALTVLDSSPEWWHPPAKMAGIIYYHSDKSTHSFASEEAHMSFDPSARQVNYHWIGID